MRCDILVVGGGCGGFGAALSAARSGLSVILTEETSWLGGQLTSQAVPPDDNPWVETFGSTQLYRTMRQRVRQTYKALGHTGTGFFNPGGGWVSNLCAEPSLVAGVLQEMVQEHPNIVPLMRHKPRAVETHGDSIRSVELTCLETGTRVTVESNIVVDATEMGDLLALASVEHVVGAESQDTTGEPHAVEGPAQPHNQQAMTWVAAVSYGPKAEPGEAPPMYDFWRSFAPDFWCGNLLSFQIKHPQTLKETSLPLFAENGYELFSYRQIVDPDHFPRQERPVTIVNWPQNDYFLAPVLGVDSEPEWDHPFPGASGPVSAQNLQAARNLTQSMIYWLQTEAPRHDSGIGYPEIQLGYDGIGTSDGLAMFPYIRESRRIVAVETLREQNVSTAVHPHRDRTPEITNSIAIGAYRIDLHPSTSGEGYIDFSSLPFQIPLGCLVPVRVTNVIPACKNLGVTHIVNGCTRLHPVEWAIGEAAGALAAVCLTEKATPQQVHLSSSLTLAVQRWLHSQGAPTAWPESEVLKPL